MARTFEHKCSRCGREVERQLLTTKKVMFKELGSSGQVNRSRVVDWLCGPCLAKDKDFLLPAHTTPNDRTPSA